MLTPKRIKSKALKRLFEHGDDSKIRPDWRRRVRRILNILDIAVSPLEFPRVPYHPHELTGDRKGTYAVTIQGNWRVTFKWDDQGPYDVNMEDYHGK